MKKLTVSLLALMAVTFGFYANHSNAITAIHEGGNTLKGKITAEASESKNVPPDTVTINLTVNTTDKVSQKAVELNNQKMTTITNAIKKLLNSNETIKTSNYDLNPDYEYNPNTKQSSLKGYTVVNTIKVTLKDTKKIAQVIDTANKNGVSNISGLSFSLQASDAVCQELTQKAAAKAKKEAEALLSPLGKSIDAIYSINYSCSTQGEYPYRSYALMKSNAAFDAAGTSAPIEEGESKVTAHVTIVFTIK